MLSPGSATALVNDALEWLQPHVLKVLPRRHALEGRCTRAVGKAPEMFCSALAAVLSFLEAHVTARQAPGDISSITKALLDSSMLPRDAASPQLLNLLSQCSASQPSETQYSAASDSNQQNEDSAPQDSAAKALPVSQSSAGACELLLAVACLGQTLAQHKALHAQMPDLLNAGIINALSGQVSRLLCIAAIINTGLQFSAFVSVKKLNLVRCTACPQLYIQFTAFFSQKHILFLVSCLIHHLNSSQISPTHAQL